MNGHKKTRSPVESKHTKIQRDFFDQRAPRWDEICQHDYEKIEYVMEKLSITGKERILDVGTGTGVLIPHYQRRLTTGSVFAFDCSKNMIEVALSKFPKKTHPNVVFAVADLYDINYECEFDLAVCYSCFPHFQEKNRAIAIIKHALKPGGLFAVAHIDSREKLNRVHTEAGEEVSGDKLPPIEDLNRLVIKAGLVPQFQQDDSDYYILIATKPQTA
ncbi:MAG TPA: class I SAM-dependent methyltransferase [Euryarchaeota archaeon]|nr:class I SAM-dependent methyltransferase [Euryarchaeota archaeon]